MTHFFPAHPSSSDTVAAELIGNAFAEDFGFHFNLQFCDYEFPVQKDGFNCGLFVCLYSISLVLDPSLKPKRFVKSPWNTESFCLLGSFGMTSQLEEPNI